jgi:hypothetical protein
MRTAGGSSERLDCSGALDTVPLSSWVLGFAGQGKGSGGWRIRPMSYSRLVITRHSPPSPMRAKFAEFTFPDVE